MSDLIGSLRALDAELAAVAPSRALQARLRARLRQQGSRWWPPGGERARVLCFAAIAAAGVALVGLGARTGAGEQAISGRAPLPPPEITPPRDVAPALDPAQRERRAAPPPPIHAPLLGHPPSRDDRREGPSRRVPAPEDAGQRMPTWLDEIDDGAPSKGPAPRPRDAAPRSSTGPGSSLWAPPRIAPRLGPLGSLGPTRAGRDASDPAPTTWVASVSGSGGPVERPERACQSAGDLKMAAMALCEKQGAVFAGLELIEPCGEGSYRDAKVTCAPPNEEPDTDACISSAVVSPVCVDPGKLKEEANALCQLKGLGLTELSLASDGCDELARAAKYTCCPAAPPPPETPAPMCETRSAGDGATCRPAVDLDIAAKLSCADDGLTLFDAWLSPGCPAEMAAKIGFTCCTYGL